MSGFSAGGQLCDAHRRSATVGNFWPQYKLRNRSAGLIDLVGHDRASQPASVTDRNGNNGFGDRRQNHDSERVPATPGLGKSKLGISAGRAKQRLLAPMPAWAQDSGASSQFADTFRATQTPAAKGGTRI